MIVYLFLALVVINGQPQLKGGTHATKAACEAHRAEMLSVLEVRHASRCKPVVLVAEIPRSP